ncbi:hypothetical protein [Streptomyces sp. NPDC005121]
MADRDEQAGGRHFAGGAGEDVPQYDAAEHGAVLLEFGGRRQRRISSMWSTTSPDSTPSATSPHFHAGEPADEPEAALTT